MSEQQVVDHPKASGIQLSIVVPVYNQEKNVTASLSRIKSAVDLTLTDYEIVVVNDGSLDRTLEILKKEQETDSRIQIISYPRNMGKGHAVKTGILNSRGNIVVFTDGDLDISPSVIKDYMTELQSFDLVIASKVHPQSKVNAPLSRRILSKAFNLIVQIGTGINLKDTQSGLKAGKGAILRTIFNIILVKRYAFDVELLAIGCALNLQVKEMPIEINLSNRFKAKEILRMFLDVAAISYRYRIRRWYQKQINLEMKK